MKIAEVIKLTKGEEIGSICTDIEGVLTIVTKRHARLELSAEAAVILANHLLHSLPLKFGAKGT
jgi:hypothetical protein